MVAKEINDVLKIDDIDRNILQIIQKEPTTPHEKIAKRVNRSQPTIGSRIKKLEKAGIFKYQAGINLKATNLLIARVDIKTKNQEVIEELVKKCPFMINVFRLSGIYNLSVLLIGFDIRQIDSIVNLHFRKNPKVKSVIMEVIESVSSDFVVPFNFNLEDCECYLEYNCLVNYKH